MLKINTSFKRFLLTFVFIGALALTLSGCKNTESLLVESVEISTPSNATTITTMNGTLQFSAIVLPSDADDQSVTWSVENDSGEATINSSGLLTAVSNGTVTVKSTSNDESNITESKVITISNQEVLAESVDISSANNANIINTLGDTLLFTATMLPSDTTDKSVVWTIENGTGEATISVNGLLTAVSNGTVTVKATSSDGLVLDTMTITISNQEVLVSSISVNGVDGVVTISSLDGTLQMVANVLPPNAEDQSVVWTVENGTGEATINQEGLLTAVLDGTVVVKATSMGQPSILGTKTVTISNQVVVVSSVSVVGFDEHTTISIIGGTLQLEANVLPLDTNDTSVLWSVENGTGEATISEDGLLTAVSNGTVLVKATSASNPLVYSTMVVTISNQEVLVSSITVNGFNGNTTITTLGGRLPMVETVLPLDAEDKTVIWTVEAVTGNAKISEGGLLTAISNGTVIVKATSSTDSNIYGTTVITISNQVEGPDVGSVSVSGFEDETTISNLGDTLQMIANIYPIDAENKAVVWTVENGTGEATIDEEGLLSPVSNGTVIVKATSVDQSDIYGTIVISISNQDVIVANPVDLGTAADFTILAKTGVSTTSGTHVTGDIGVSPAALTYITGFDVIMHASGEYATSSLVTGKIYAADLAAPTPTNLTTAIGDMQLAYTDAAGRSSDYTELYAGDISGQTLEAGVYKWSSGLLINTDVTLNGSATDVFIFQISGTLTQAAGAQVILTGGILAENIFWQVADTVTIGTGAHMEGTILAKKDVVLATSATMNGKVLAQTAVTLDANTIN